MINVLILDDVESQRNAVRDALVKAKGLRNPVSVDDYQGVTVTAYQGLRITSVKRKEVLTSVLSTTDSFDFAILDLGMHESEFDGLNTLRSRDIKSQEETAEAAPPFARILKIKRHSPLCYVLVATAYQPAEGVDTSMLEAECANCYADSVFYHRSTGDLGTAIKTALDTVTVRVQAVAIVEQSKDLSEGGFILTGNERAVFDIISAARRWSKPPPRWWTCHQNVYWAIRGRKGRVRASVARAQSKASNALYLGELRPDYANHGLCICWLHDSWRRDFCGQSRGFLPASGQWHPVLGRIPRLM